MTDREIRKKAKSFMKEYSLNKVDYDSLCDITEKLGYVVAEFDPCLEDSAEYELAKMLKFSDKLQNTRGMTYAAGEYRLVFVDDRLSISEKLIVLAHEIGHIVLGHMDRNYVIGRDVVEEYEANVFASFLVDKKQSSAAGRFWLIGGIAMAGVIIATVLITYHIKSRQVAGPTGDDSEIIGMVEKDTSETATEWDVTTDEVGTATEATETISEETISEETISDSEVEIIPEDTIGDTTGDNESEIVLEETMHDIKTETGETLRPAYGIDTPATAEQYVEETTVEETTVEATMAKETTVVETATETTIVPETTHTHVVESTTSVSADKRKLILESYCKECGEKTYSGSRFIYPDLDDAYTLDKLATMGLYGDLSDYNQFYAGWLIRERGIGSYSDPDWSCIRIIPISDEEMASYQTEILNGISQKFPGHGSTTPEIILDKELCSIAQAELEKYAFEKKSSGEIKKNLFDNRSEITYHTV